MNRTAKLLGVSTPTIQAWLEQFAAAYAQKPEPEGRAVVIELDDMWHYLKKSPSRSGSGKLGIVLQASWWTGSAAVVTYSCLYYPCFSENVRVRSSRNAPDLT